MTVRPKLAGTPIDRSTHPRVRSIQSKSPGRPSDGRAAAHTGRHAAREWRARRKSAKRRSPARRPGAAACDFTAATTRGHHPAPDKRPRPPKSIVGRRSSHLINTTRNPHTSKGAAVGRRNKGQKQRQYAPLWAEPKMPPPWAPLLRIRDAATTSQGKTRHEGTETMLCLIGFDREEPLMCPERHRGRLGITSWAGVGAITSRPRGQKRGSKKSNKKIFARGLRRIELLTSPTRKENHTTRPKTLEYRTWATSLFT